MRKLSLILFLTVGWTTQVFAQTVIPNDEQTFTGNSLCGRDGGKWDRTEGDEFEAAAEGGRTDFTFD